MKGGILAVVTLVFWSLPTRSPERGIDGRRVRGNISPSGDYEEFLSIPYATVSKRYQAATPIPKWVNTFEAIDEHKRCIQRIFSFGVTGEEDCLTLNIYKPLGTSEPLPVMVFIHGGGFREGSNAPFLYGPKYFMAKNVLLVSVNYRLEIAGFLCLRTKEAPGNAGLKDQVAALKWIKENIAEFGGDPDNVTLFGESAGSVSVAFHLLSPMSKGLFHKAILQSGVATVPWGLQKDPIKTAADLAYTMGFKTDDPNELYNIFMNKTMKELLKARIPRKNGTSVLSELVFVPCIEQHNPTTEAFLTEHPFQILKNGNFNQVPLIIGYNEIEGLFFTGLENETTLSVFNYFDAMPQNLEFLNDNTKKKIVNEVTDLYQSNVDENINDNITRFISDAYIKFHVIEFTHMFSNKNNYHVFSYKFSYDGWLNIPKQIMGFRTVPYATHSDELFYMFSQGFPTMWSFETAMIDKMTTLWTNFAKFSDPSPQNMASPVKWLPITDEEPRTLVIDKEFSNIPLWGDKETLFWKDVFTKYRKY